MKPVSNTPNNKKKIIGITGVFLIFISLHLVAGFFVSIFILGFSGDAGPDSNLPYILMLISCVLALTAFVSFISGIMMVLKSKSNIMILIGSSGIAIPILLFLGLTLCNSIPLIINLLSGL